MRDLVGTRLRARAVGCTTVLLAVLSGACSTRLHEADHAWDAGELTTAAQSYESLLKEPEAPVPRDQLLFRLALTYLDSTTQLYEPARALASLQELVVQFPTSPYRRPAEIVAGLVRVVEETEDDLVCILGERESLLERSVELDAAVEDSQRRLAELEGALESARGELDRARRALEELKGIDLGSYP